MKKADSTDLIQQQNKRLEELKHLEYDKSSFKAGFFDGYGFAHIEEYKDDFKGRLIVEYKQIKEKTIKLINFINNYENCNKMDIEDWNMLTVQRDIMISYVSILENRLIKLNLQDAME